MAAHHGTGAQGWGHLTQAAGQATRIYAKPESFDGNAKDLPGFLTQMRIHFLLHQDIIRTEEHKILATMGFLKGRALEWFQPIAQDFITHKHNDMMEDETEEACANWEAMAARFTELFGDPDMVRTKERGLRELKQTGSASDYSTKFQTIASGLGWEDEPLMDRYYAGLKDSVKSRLVELDRPLKLTSLIELAVRIDNRQYEWRMERQGRTPALRPRGPAKVGRMRGGTMERTSAGRITEPMELDTVTTMESGRNNKKTQWRKNGACLGCGRKGHYVKECPDKKGRQPQANTRKFGMVEVESVHERLHWTGCYNDACETHYWGKHNAGWWPKEPRKQRKTRRGRQNRRKDTKTRKEPDIRAFWIGERQELEPGETYWTGYGQNGRQHYELLGEDNSNSQETGESSWNNGLWYPLTYGVGLAVSRERMALIGGDPTPTLPNGQNESRNTREAPPPYQPQETRNTSYTRQTTVAGTELPWLGQSPNPFGVTTWNGGRPQGLTEEDGPEYSPLHEDHERVHWTKCFYDRCVEHLDDKARNWWFPRRVSAEVLKEDTNVQSELEWFQVAEWAEVRPGERRFTWVARDEECPARPEGWRFCTKPGCWYHGGDWEMYTHRQDTYDQDDVLGGQEVTVTPEQGRRIAALMEAAREGSVARSTRGSIRRGMSLEDAARLPGSRRDAVTRRALRDATDTWAKQPETESDPTGREALGLAKYLYGIYLEIYEREKWIRDEWFKQESEETTQPDDSTTKN